MPTVALSLFMIVAARIDRIQRQAVHAPNVGRFVPE
jgi:hypothetical protein